MENNPPNSGAPNPIQSRVENFPLAPNLPPPIPVAPPVAVATLDISYAPPPLSEVLPPPLPANYFNTEPLPYQSVALPPEWVSIASIDTTGQWFSAKRQLAVYQIDCIMQTQTGSDATWLAVPAQSVKLANQVLFPAQNVQPKFDVVSGFPLDPISRPGDPSQMPQELVNIRPVAPIVGPTNPNRYLGIQILLWVLLVIGILMGVVPFLIMTFVN